MAEHKYCCVRFNLNKPEHRRAWNYLQCMDKDEMKSYSNAIIQAINAYFENVNEDISGLKLINSLVRLLQSEHDPTCTDKGTEKDAELNIPWEFLGE